MIVAERSALVLNADDWTSIGRGFLCKKVSFQREGGGSVGGEAVFVCNIL